MKHIKKKYQVELKIKNNLNSTLIQSPLSVLDQEVLKSNYKKNNLLLLTEDDEGYLGFIYNNQGTYVPIVLPDFTLVYFDFAYNLNKNRKEIQKTLLNKLKDFKTITEDRSIELYEFFGISTSCIINLFTSIESFINHLIPKKQNYKLTKNSRTEIYNCEQIQENIPFMDKIKYVLPQFFEKNFYDENLKAKNHIQNLKELRDSLIHTKSNSTYKTHIETFEKLLNFKYTETFDSVQLLFNYYKPNYIEPCSCNNDF